MNSQIDLSKLTKEEKLKLIDALDEKARRKLEKREAFIPIPEQLTVLQSPKTVRAVFAGNGFGKTTLAANAALYAASGYNPHTGKHYKVPATIVVVLDKPSKVEDLWLPKIQEYYPLKPNQLDKRGKPYVSQIDFPNGSKIVFMFHDQDPMSFESIELDAVIFDEPPPRHVYVALRRGGRKKGTEPWYLIIGTPIAAPWLRKEIYEPWARGEAADTECFRYSTAANIKNLKANYIEEYGSILSEKEKRVRFEGEFFDLDGLALAHLFSRDHHVTKPFLWPKNWPVVIAIDPHPSKAHYAVMLGCDPHDQLYVLKTLRSKSTAKEFAGELAVFGREFNVVNVVCDSLGNAATTGGVGRLSFIEVVNTELRAKGSRFKVRATTYDEKDDEAWIQIIQDVLLIPDKDQLDNMGNRKTPRLRIFEGNHGMVNDIESVCWTKYRNMDEYKPKLAIENKDYLSTLKYALACQPHWRMGSERVIRNKPSPYSRKGYKQRA
jgi:hypothetical protein